MSESPGTNPLHINLLGEISVHRGDGALTLPPSKKTRALLAYLVLSGREHRRERLCALLWDVVDDPRGALRWSLSRLRSILDEPGTRRIAADRQSVKFNVEGAVVDLFKVRDAIRGGVDTVDTTELESLSSVFRGELLEGLELADFHDFQSWCLAEREQTRVMRATILEALVDRLADEPARALPYARALVQVDPLNEHTRTRLVELLVKLGRRSEAEQQFNAANRVFTELGADMVGELARYWQAASQINVAPTSRSKVESPGDHPPPAPEAPPEATMKLIGRVEECRHFDTLVRQAGTTLQIQTMLLTGEPGAGKSRLLAELTRSARERSCTVLSGESFEAETGRPYGPWIDALRRLHATSGTAIDQNLDILVPELASSGDSERSREQLFAAVSELVTREAHREAPLIVLFDDVQWLDPSSAALLHYVLRVNPNLPVVVVLAARTGEIADNVRFLEVLRSLRRKKQIEEVRVGPLSCEETAALIAGLQPTLDAKRIHAESAGNALFALELARAGSSDGPGRTLTELVRERLDRIAPEAGDVLRWGALLGHSFGVEFLDALTATDLDSLIAALDTLEAHDLLRVTGDDGGNYNFAHDVVRQVVLGDISLPRRRLMHKRIAATISAAGKSDKMAADLAHHAALGGEMAVAARACLSAARRCLRVFATDEAETLVRRGRRYSDELPASERVKLFLEFAEVSYEARRPQQIEEATAAIESLAREALSHGHIKHARLGFHLLSYLRWEDGDITGARKSSMQAAQIARAGSDKDRLAAISEAARCLVVLERDLPQAEGLLLEAQALSEKVGVEPFPLLYGRGILKLHRGSVDEAIELFSHARVVAQSTGDRMSEFYAIEQLVIGEIQRRGYESARLFSDELVAIAEKLRSGSEMPTARALIAVCHYMVNEDDTGEILDLALRELRMANAKQRLIFALTAAAFADLEREDYQRARQRAEEALAAAIQVSRPSDVALSRVIISRAAMALGESNVATEHATLLRDDLTKSLSRKALDAFGEIEK